MLVYNARMVLKFMKYESEEQTVKKVINGKMYNTETAKKLTEQDFYRDGNWVYSEALYIKRTGEYFLETSANGGDYFAPDDGIEPYSLSEAKRWAETHLDGDDYEKIFGEVNEDDIEHQQRFGLLIPVAIYEELKAKKDASGTNISAQIVRTLRDAGYGKDTLAS